MNNSGQRPPIKGPSPLHHQYCKMPPNNLVERSFKYHLIILKILGLYPFDCCPKIYLPYAFTFYICFTVTIPILALTSIFTTGEHDIEAISQKGFMIVELMALIVKVLPCKVNPEGTRRTMYNLNRDIFNRQLPEQEFILTNCVRNCKYVLMIFFTTCFLAIMTWAVSPLMYDERRFPFSVWLPYEPFENTKIYLASYTLIFLCVFNGGIGNSVVDSLVALLIYHAACQIRVLKDTLLHLNQRTEVEIAGKAKPMSPDEEEELRNSIIYKRICECIDHYDAIYQFVEDLEKTYSVVLFSQMISSIIVICICCLHLSMAIPLSIPFIATCSFTTGILMEQFLYCYSGMLLNEESDTVVTAAYMSDWYTYDEKSKQALFILMERAKRPMKVTAGKLLDLSLVTFATIMRRSYSLLAVLKNY